MSRGWKFLIAQVTVGLILAPAAVYGNSGGPNPFLTGDPKTPDSGVTCTQCHTGSIVNLAQGKVQITLAGPPTYVPGQSQQVTVVVSDPSQSAWGFQLTSRVLTTNEQAGNLTATDPGTFVQCGDFSNPPCLTTSTANKQFIQQNPPKRGAGSGTFTFNWTAPATNVGTIVFYAAGNAANNNGNLTGDHIYTTSLQLTAAAASNSPAISLVAPASGTASTVTAGSWVSIYGTNLATTAYLLTDADRVSGAIPTTLQNVSVKVNGKPAFVYFVSAIQVNVQAPDDTSKGPVSVVVTSSGVTGNTGSVTLSAYAPTLFLFDAKHVVGVIPTTSGGFYGDGTYDLLGPPGSQGFNTRGAKKGEFIELFGTGFGPTAITVAAGQPFDGASNTTAPVTVTIGGIPANVSFAGLRYAGEYQINVTVPANAPSGDQPVVVSVGGVQAQPGLVITVQ